jgi:hypothetical protein
MRRPVMYLAGLLLATGASFAIAGPASAAVSHDAHAGVSSPSGFGGGDDYDYDFDYRSLSYDMDYSLDYQDNDHYSQVSLLNLGSPVGNNNQAQGLGSLLGGIS